MACAGCQKDAGVPIDADLGMPDLMAPPPGADLAHIAVAPDLSPGPDLATNPAGPWPVTDLVVYGAAQGLGGNLIDAGPDGAQNIWAASADGLYVLRPGAPAFLKFTAANGLHIQPFTDPFGNPAVTNITAVAGGGAGEVFVGYYGYESDDRLHDTVANMELGQADKVTLATDGTISVLKYNFRCDYASNWCWENRSVRRMTYAHTGTAAGHLFIGFDHGVSHVFQDRFGDHIHVEAFDHYPDGGVTQRQGEQWGLFVLPNGDLWTASAHGVGLQPWNPEPHFSWVDGVFKEAFVIFTDTHDTGDTPGGYREDDRGIAETADGNVWIATLNRGLASWNRATPHNYQSIKTDWNVPANLLDLAADPDGTLWLVSGGGQLLRFDPKANGYTVFAGVSGVRRVVLDTTVTPRALYISTGAGLAVFRGK
jgi:hypothetical protein